MKKFFITILLTISIIVIVKSQSTENFVIQPVHIIYSNADIFPNPTTKPYFYVKSSQIISQIIVIDLVGNTIVNRKFTSYYSEKIKIELPNDTPKGLYLIKIIFDDKSYVIKKLIYK